MSKLSAREKVERGKELAQEQELKKKLAEWRFGKDGVKYGKTLDDKLVIYRRTRWIEEDEEWGIEILEDLTQSLDACFKWLVPKLVSGDIHIEWYTRVDDTAVELKRATSTIAFVCQPSPALALCLAIEKLIDGEK